MRKFYRTVIEVEILSEEPYDPPSLDVVSDDIVMRACSGNWGIKSSEEVDGKRMAAMLIEQGSDPEFFGLDEDGNDLLSEDESTDDKPTT